MPIFYLIGLITILHSVKVYIHYNYLLKENSNASISYVGFMIKVHLLKAGDSYKYHTALKYYPMLETEVAAYKRINILVYATYLLIAVVIGLAINMAKIQ